MLALAAGLGSVSGGRTSTAMLRSWLGGPEFVLSSDLGLPCVVWLVRADPLVLYELELQWQKELVLKKTTMPPARIIPLNLHVTPPLLHAVPHLPTHTAEDLQLLT